MLKIDRLGWAAGFAFESFGTRAGVRSNDPAVLELLAERLPPGWRPARSLVVERLYSLFAAHPARRRGVRRFQLLYGDAERLARTEDLEEALEAFESDVQLRVAEAAEGRLFVHAGVVGWRGRAVILPGRSFTGKSTLVAELVRAGADYYSDEYAVLDPKGRVHPFARPLSLRDGASRRRLPLESLGGGRSRWPLRAGLVVVSEYRAGARWRPRRLSSGRGLLALLANTVAARRRPEAALDTLRQVTEHAAVIKGARGEAAEVAASILESLERARAAGF